jgi:MFS family permease
MAGAMFSVAGLGHAACWAPVMGLASKWVPDNRRGMALSLVGMGVGVGISLWSFLLPPIVSAWNWRAGWAAMGVYGLGVAALNVWLVRNPVDAEPPASSAQSQIVRILRTYKLLLGNKTFQLIGIAYLLVGFNVLVPFTFLPVYTSEALNFAYATATKFPAAIAMFGIIGQLTLGPLSDAMGRSRVLMICGAIMGLACLGMVYLTTAFWLFTATAFYGLGYGAVWPMYAAAASDYFPKGEAGSVVGLWTVYLGLGSIISPIVCGWTIDLTGSYRWTFYLGLLSGLLSVLMLAFIPKKHA